MARWLISVTTYQSGRKLSYLLLINSVFPMLRLFLVMMCSPLPKGIKDPVHLSRTCKLSEACFANSSPGPLLGSTDKLCNKGKEKESSSLHPSPPPTGEGHFALPYFLFSSRLSKDVSLNRKHLLLWTLKEWNLQKGKSRFRNCCNHFLTWKSAMEQKILWQMCIL